MGLLEITRKLRDFGNVKPACGKILEELLTQAAEADAQVHEQAVGATYAGEADPYRHPREDGDE